jgi:hypothetical protein
MRLCSVSAARADDHARLPLRSREGRVQPHHLQPDATTRHAHRCENPGARLRSRARKATTQGSSPSRPDQRGAPACGVLHGRRRPENTAA